MEKETIKRWVIFLLIILIAMQIASAHKFSAKNGGLARLNNITGFIDERTSSTLKADVRDGNGRVFIMVKSQNRDGDKVLLKVDLRKPSANNNQISGYAKVYYKITNNGIYVIDPTPDSRGYFHKVRINQKPVIRETTTEKVTLTFEGNYIDITSESFEIRDLLLNINE